LASAIHASGRAACTSGLTSDCTVVTRPVSRRAARQAPTLTLPIRPKPPQPHPVEFPFHPNWQRGIAPRPHWGHLDKQRPCPRRLYRRRASRPSETHDRMRAMPIPEVDLPLGALGWELSRNGRAWSLGRDDRSVPGAVGGHSVGRMSVTTRAGSARSPQHDSDEVAAIAVHPSGPKPAATGRSRRRARSGFAVPGAPRPGRGRGTRSSAQAVTTAADSRTQLTGRFGSTFRRSGPAGTGSLVWSRPATTWGTSSGRSPAITRCWTLPTSPS
jgi:hypothetical protein